MMDLQTRKIEFVQEFLKLQNEEAVTLLETMLQAATKDRFQPMNIQELNSRIEQSEEGFANGRYKTHEEVFAKFKKWDIK